MRNLSNTRLVVTGAAILALYTALTWPPPLRAQAPPQIPATFYGAITVEGLPARDGAVVQAFIDGRDCTQAGAAGAIRDGEATRYVVAVVHESQVPGCGVPGASVVFRVDGAAAEPAATWQGAPQEVNLSAGPPAGAVSASPSPVPSPSVISELPGPSGDGGGGAPIVLWVALGGVVAAALGGAAVAVARKSRGKGAGRFIVRAGYGRIPSENR